MSNTKILSVILIVYVTRWHIIFYPSLGAITHVFIIEQNQCLKVFTNNTLISVSESESGEEED